MNKKVVVKIIEAPYASAFEKFVQERLDEGWTAQWPMQIDKFGNLYLPMTKSVDIDKQVPIDETITKQHPDAKKLGGKGND